MESFRDCLSKFTRFSRLVPLATLNYAADICNASNIVSSIEFDASGDHFAIAGVTRRIKVSVINHFVSLFDSGVGRGNFTLSYDATFPFSRSSNMSL